MMRVLKLITLVLLPALAALYSALSDEWLVTGLMTVNAVFGLFLLLRLRSAENDIDGEVNLFTDPEGYKTFQLDISKNPDALEAKDRIIFKVNRSSG